MRGKFLEFDERARTPSGKRGVKSLLSEKETRMITHKRIVLLSFLSLQTACLNQSMEPVGHSNPALDCEGCETTDGTVVLPDGEQVSFRKSMLSTGDVEYTYFARDGEQWNVDEFERAVRVARANQFAARGAMSEALAEAAAAMRADARVPVLGWLRYSATDPDRHAPAELIFARIDRRLVYAA